MNVSWSVDDALVVLDGKRSPEEERDGSEGRRVEEVSSNTISKDRALDGGIPIKAV